MTVASKVFTKLKEETKGKRDTLSLYETARRTLHSLLFPQQLALVLDPHDHLAARTARRCAKTYSAVARHFETHLSTPCATTFIFSITQQIARRQYWPIFQRLSQQLGIPLKFNKQTLEIEWPCGGMTYLIGCDATSEIDKARGIKQHGSTIDECKSHSQALLKELIEDVIEPAILETGGWILLIGTPGTILSGTFYEITSGIYEISEDNITGERFAIARSYNEKDSEHWRDVKFLWSFHSWTQKDNIYLVNPKTGKHMWEHALELKRVRRWSDDHPTWLREFLGIWAVNPEGLVFPYAKLRNIELKEHKLLVSWKEGDAPFNLPDFPLKSWHFYISLDLGFSSATAIVIGAYNDYENKLYYPADFKKAGMKTKDIAAQMKYFRTVLSTINRSFSLELFDMAGSGAAQVMNDLNSEYGCNFIPATKKSKDKKYQLLQLMGDYMEQGQIRVHPNTELATEMSQLQWKVNKTIKKDDLEKLGKLEEDKSTPNHCSDAALYIFKHWHTKHAVRNVEEDTKHSTVSLEQLEFDRVRAKLLVDSRNSIDDYWLHDLLNIS